MPWFLPIGPKSCFYWASKLPRGTFWAGLKSLAAAFDGFSTAQPSAAALEASRLLCHGASLLAPKAVSIGLLPRGTFWAGLKTLKSLAAAFDGFSTAQPSAAALAASRLLCHGASLLAPKAVSIGLRNCRVARFGQAFKPSKASQELSTASAPHNPPQQLSQRPAGFAMVPPYWPQKLFLLGFETAAWHVLGKPYKLRSSFRRLQHCTTLRSSSRSVPLALPWCLRIGPKSCFYWASKLPRGTFWAGLKSLAAAFDGFSTAQPSAAALEASRLLCHGASLLAPQAVSIGLRNCRVARFGQAFKPSKPSQELSKASAPHNPPQQLSQRPACFAMVPPKSCFYWASQLPRGTFWASLQTLKSFAGAFEGLSTAQPSAAALEASRLLCHGFSLLAPKAVSIGLRNSRVARFGQALKPSKASQQLSIRHIILSPAASVSPPQQAILYILFKHFWCQCWAHNKFQFWNISSPCPRLVCVFPRLLCLSIHKPYLAPPLMRGSAAPGR